MLAAPTTVSAATTTSSDWPGYLYDATRDSASTETALNTSVAPQLRQLWSYKTGGTISTSVTIVGGTAYVGSWDGYEYAFNATTGALLWKTNLGVTVTPACSPTSAGVSSTASVVNGVVYLGGGDAYWYALDASTGAVLWRVYTGDNSATGGHYNWSSPLIYNGYAYIGIASMGDCPLVQGQVLQVSLSTHQVVNTFNVVPNGQVGGGIWTTPALDAATNTIYVTTGTINNTSQIYSQALLALDASTLTLKDSWQLPAASAVLDSDWGNTPILFTDANGRKLVAATNKNGYVYAFDRTHLSAGPVWQRAIAVGGDCPTCGDGSVSSGAFANGMLFMAGGNTTINGIGYQGGVRALNPTTGAILWEHGDSGVVVPALAYENGLVLVGAGNVLEVLDAATGTRLYSFATNAMIFAPPSVSNGIVYVSGGDGTVYALALPSTTPPPPPADPQCPSGWVCQDIGAPATAGSESTSGATWTVNTSGSGVGGTSDQFRLISQTVSGDTQLTAQVTAVPTTGTGAQTGVMLRQSADAGSPYYAVFATPNNGLAVQYRSAWNGATKITTRGGAGQLPLYVQIQRTGDLMRVATSTDGTTFTLVPGTNATVVLPKAMLAGVAVSAGTGGTSGTGTVNAVAVGPISTTPQPAPSASPCPSGWSCADVGNPSPVGDQTLSNGTWSISAAGSDIIYYADQFHFVWQPLAADGAIAARVTAQSNTSSNAKAGVMLRQDTSAGSVVYGAFMTPSNGIKVLERASSGLRISTVLSIASTTTPAYVEVARSGSTFSTYTSTDGANWTYVTGSSVSLPMSGQVLAGLAVTSATAGTLGTATFDSVSLSTTAPPLPATCLSGWTCGDIGNPLPAGSDSISGSVWTVQGGGSDIWGTSDQFHFDSQALAGDGAISAHITGQTNSSAWAKAGVMLRATMDPAAPYYAVYVTPTNGLAVQYRTAAGASALQSATATGTVPVYLRVARTGTTFTASTSTDGTTWTPIAGSSVTISALSGSILAGLAVTSHNGGTASTVTADNLTVTASSVSGACPTGWTCADVGAPALAGSQTVSNGTWSVQGAGNDIWGTSDQFRFEYQSLAVDGSMSADVTSQTNTSPWAKAGVMLRATTDPGSAFYAAYVTPGNGLAVQYRTAAGASAQQAVQVAGATPVYLRVTRSGTTFTASTSTDGATWTPIAGSSVTISGLSGSVLAGLAVLSQNGSALSTVTFQSVALIAVTCASGWTCGDIGNPLPAGSDSISGSVWTVQGGGSDIWGTSDQFHFDSQALAGDGAISAHITGQTNSSAWAKAGVMLRLSTDPAAPFYAAYVTPTNGLAVQYRTAAGASALQSATATGTVPVYLRVARAGTTFTATTSTDGTTWTPIPGSSHTISALSGSILAGLAVLSHHNGTASTVTADTVSVTTTATPPPNTCPTGWACSDVGAPALAGSESVSGGVWTVQGAGGDIWGTSDQFHFDAQSLAADGGIAAHVTAQTNTSAWAKAGVMLRLSTDPAAPFYAVYVTPGNGIAVQYRATAGGNASDAGRLTGSVPAYLKVARAGTTFTAYTSSDGTTWTPVPGSSVSVASMSGSVLAGLAVTSHNSGAICTATFDTVVVG